MKPSINVNLLDYLVMAEKAELMDNIRAVLQRSIDQDTPKEEMLNSLADLYEELECRVAQITKVHGQ